MKLFSNPSAPEKPDLDETASELDKTVSGPSNEIPKDTPPWEIRNADFQTIEVVTIEDERIRKHEWSFVEFCPQFVAILPGNMYRISVQICTLRDFIFECFFFFLGLQD